MATKKKSNKPEKTKTPKEGVDYMIWEGKKVSRTYYAMKTLGGGEILDMRAVLK